MTGVQTCALPISTGIAAYFAYVARNGGQWITTKCDPEKVRCNVAGGLAAWFSIFLQIVVLGLPYISLGSLSNANYPKLYRFPALLIGMGTVFLVTVSTYRYVSSLHLKWVSPLCCSPSHHFLDVPI